MSHDVGEAQARRSSARRSRSGLRRAPSPTTLRWALAAVAIGAVVAAGITFLLTGGAPERDKLQTGRDGANGAMAGAAFGTAQPGDCLSWTESDYSDLSKVDCGKAHLFEVAANIDLNNYPGTEFGSDAAYPGEIRMGELNLEHCLPAAQRYLNGHLDPHGKFRVGMINPGKAGWSAGERTLRCGIQASGVSGHQRPITGTVASQDQSNIFEPGTCKLPHAFEVASTVDLGRYFSVPPTAEEQDKFMTGACDRDVAKYLGSPGALRNKTLTTFWDQIDPDSWLGGSHLLNCWIGKGGDQAYAPIEGSAKGDILINGKRPVPPPPLPAGRNYN
ncbi:MAG: septum formation family protein [Mycobacteriaceae bacterium]|nr:septum formation family protein [Mycobacteriaceae bacterium]